MREADLIAPIDDNVLRRKDKTKVIDATVKQKGGKVSSDDDL